MQTATTRTLTTAELSEILDRPQHRIRRAVDRLFPTAPRAGRTGTRLISTSMVCQIAAAIVDEIPPRGSQTSKEPGRQDAQE